MGWRGCAERSARRREREGKPDAPAARAARDCRLQESTADYERSKLAERCGACAPATTLPRTLVW